MTDTSTDTDERPPSTALGVVVDSPPAGWTPYKILGEAICYDEEGNVRVWPFNSPNIEHFEALGLLAAHEHYLRAMSQRVVMLFQPPGEDDE